MLRKFLDQSNLISGTRVVLVFVKMNAGSDLRILVFNRD